MAKAIKKIKKGINKMPKDADNWVVWGLIMRTVGNYSSAKKKFKRAIKLDPNNETAYKELEIVERIIELDEQIPLDQVPSIKKPLNKGSNTGLATKPGDDTCARSCQNTSCFIF